MNTNKLKLSFDEYAALVSDLARSISKSDWRPEYIVGITRGGLLPAVMLSHYFDVKCYTLDVSLRDANSQDCESNAWMAEDAYNGKNILIVDDINDTGATINWIIQDWKSSCCPNDSRWHNLWNRNIKIATVIDNTASRCSVKVDYCAKEINKMEDDVWIVFPYEDFWSRP